MSDGITESHKYMRKETYLNSIELSKDQLFDQYMVLSEKIIIITNMIINYSKSNKTFFGNPCGNYEEISRMERELLVTTTKLKEIKKYISKLDQDYEEAEKKPLNEFK